MSTPVFLTAQWRALAMVNYEIAPAVLTPHLPAGTELDFHNGRTFVSLVGFLFRDTRLLGWSIPWHRSFEEINLRFYIRREVDGEIRRGVAFLKEIVPRWAVSTVARRLYGENYVTLPTRHEVVEDVDQGSAIYEWKFRGRWNRLSVTGDGPLQFADPESEEHFITEHYWGYTRRGETTTSEYEVVHPSWQLWENCNAEVDCDIATLYGEQFVEAMSAKPSSCLLADGSAVSVHRGTRIVTGASSHRRTCEASLHDGG